MVLTQAERARMVVKWLSGKMRKSQQEIGNLVGYGNASAFSQVLNAKKDLPKVLIERICSLDPRINIDFLTGDSDEMFVDGAGADSRPQERPQTEQAGTSSTQSVKAAKSGFFVPAELADMINGLAATIQDQQVLIGDQQKMIHSLVNTWIKEKEGGK